MTASAPQRLRIAADSREQSTVCCLPFSTFMTTTLARTTLCSLVGLALCIGDGRHHLAATARFSGSEKPIAVLPGIQTDPTISGRYIVFTDLSAGNADV